MSLRTKYSQKCKNPKRQRRREKKPTENKPLEITSKVGVQILDDAFVKMEKIEFIVMYSVGSLVKYREEDKFPFK